MKEQHLSHKTLLWESTLFNNTQCGILY